MAIESVPIQISVRTAQLLGLLSLIITAWLLAVFFIDASDLMVAPVIVSGVRGVLLLIFAARMEAGDRWAFIATSVVCGIELVPLAMSVLVWWMEHPADPLLGPFWFNVLTRLPCAYLLAWCLNSLSDVRDMGSERKRTKMMAKSQTDGGPAPAAPPSSAESTQIPQKVAAPPMRMPPRPTLKPGRPRREPESE